jgi:hypothetical protein
MPALSACRRGDPPRPLLGLAGLVRPCGRSTLKSPPSSSWAAVAFSYQRRDGQTDRQTARHGRLTWGLTDVNQRQTMSGDLTHSLTRRTHSQRGEATSNRRHPSGWLMVGSWCAVLLCWVCRVYFVLAPPPDVAAVVDSREFLSLPIARASRCRRVVCEPSPMSRSSRRS